MNKYSVNLALVSGHWSALDVHLSVDSSAGTPSSTDSNPVSRQRGKPAIHVPSSLAFTRKNQPKRGHQKCEARYE